MAPPMMCDHHGLFDGDKCPQSACSGFWRPAAAEQLPLCDAPGCAMTRPCRLHPDVATRAEVIVRQGPRAAAPHEPAPGALARPVEGLVVQLRFPWGPVTVPESGTLTIGRDFGTECGCDIEGFDNVSRVHADVRVHDGVAVVQDLASTNGTTVNGQPTTAYTDQRLHDGDILGFGADLRAVVEMKADDR